MSMYVVRHKGFTHFINGKHVNVDNSAACMSAKNFIVKAFNLGSAKPGKVEEGSDYGLFLNDARKESRVIAIEFTLTIKGEVNDAFHKGDITLYEETKDNKVIGYRMTHYSTN